MRVLSSLRVRLALLVLLLAVPAALLIHFFAARAGEALLAQHPGSQLGSGHALLGQEILGLAMLGALALAAVWIGSRLLVVRGPGTLLSAAERLAAGDLRSRTGMDRDRGGEVGRLAGAFDDMASAIESRESRLRATLSELWGSWREAKRATELAEVDKARADLFSSITHDLRSPLTSIKAASTLMLEYNGELEEKTRRELLETVQEAADSLDRLITNAVQLSRSRSGGLHPRRIAAAMDEVASRTLERLRHRLREHRVVLMIPEDLPEVQVDVVLLDLVLTNLLENSVRFSPAGTEITLSVVRRESSLIVRVEDRGPGIPAEEREHALEPFVKLTAGGGAGLGLAITRAIVEAHGGHMTIEGAPAGGTVVVLELPLGAVVVPELSAERIS